MSQGTQTGALYQPRGLGRGGRWERGSQGSIHIYTYGWFMLMFDRKQQNSIKQLSFNLKNKFFKSLYKFSLKESIFILGFKCFHRQDSIYSKVTIHTKIIMSNNQKNICTWIILMCLCVCIYIYIWYIYIKFKIG